MAKGRFYFYSLSFPLATRCYFPLRPFGFATEIVATRTAQNKSHEICKCPLWSGLSLRLRLCSQFINLPRIISANPTTRQCHVPGGLPYRSACSVPVIRRGWFSFGPPAQQVKALPTALMREGNPGRGIYQRERSTKTVHPFLWTSCGGNFWRQFSFVSPHRFTAIVNFICYVSCRSCDWWPRRDPATIFD